MERGLHSPTAGKRLANLSDSAGAAVLEALENSPHGGRLSPRLPPASLHGALGDLPAAKGKFEIDTLFHLQHPGSESAAAAELPPAESRKKIGPYAEVAPEADMSSDVEVGCSALRSPAASLAASQLKENSNKGNPRPPPRPRPPPPQGGTSAAGRRGAPRTPQEPLLPHQRLFPCRPGGTRAPAVERGGSGQGWRSDSPVCRQAGRKRRELFPLGLGWYLDTPPPSPAHEPSTHNRVPSVARPRRLLSIWSSKLPFSGVFDGVFFNGKYLGRCLLSGLGEGICTGLLPGCSQAFCYEGVLSASVFHSPSANYPPVFWPFPSVFFSKNKDFFPF